MRNLQGLLNLRRPYRAARRRRRFRLRAAVELLEDRTLLASPVNPPVDPGNGAATIRGMIWHDVNGNGVRDPAGQGIPQEPVLPGWTVYIDADENGSYSIDEPARITSETGEYEFQDVVAGIHQVRQIVKPGWVRTFPALDNLQSVAVADTDIVTTVNFGNRRVAAATGTIEGYKWDDINGNGIRDNALIVGDRPTVVFIIDASGSTRTTFVGGDVGDVNGDGTTNSIMDGELAGFIALNTNLIARGLGDAANIGVIVFGSDASALDMDPATAGMQRFTSPSADADGNGVADVQQILQAVQINQQGSLTNYESAFQESIQLLTGTGSASDHNIIFLSDGLPNTGGSHADEVEAIQTSGANLRAFGVGNSSSLFALQQIDPNASIFTTTDEVLDAFSGLSGGVSSFAEPGLANWRIYVDLNDNGMFDPGDLSAVTDADGEYRIENVPAGRFDVREVDQRDWRQTFPGNSDTIFNINFDQEALGPILPHAAGALLPLTRPTSVVVDSDSDGRVVAAAAGANHRPAVLQGTRQSGRGWSEMRLMNPEEFRSGLATVSWTSGVTSAVPADAGFETSVMVLGGVGASGPALRLRYKANRRLEVTDGIRATEVGHYAVNRADDFELRMDLNSDSYSLLVNDVTVHSGFLGGGGTFHSLAFFSRATTTGTAAGLAVDNIAVRRSTIGHNAESHSVIVGDGTHVEDVHFGNREITAPVDLVIRELELLDFSAGSATYRYVIENVGRGIVDLDGLTSSNADNVSLRAVVSSDQVLGNADDRDGGSQILGFSPLGRLAQGETFEGTLTTSVQVHLETHPYLIVEVDSERVVTESNEANNTSTLRMERPPDLIVSDLWITSFDDDSITYGYTVQNIGPGTAYLNGPGGVGDNVSLNAFLSADDQHNNGADRFAGIEFLGIGNITRLSPGQSVSGSVTAAVSVDTAAYPWLTVMVDRSHVLRETDENNNVAAVLIDPKPDLVITDLTVTAADNFQLRYDYTIRNVGTQAANLDGPGQSNADNVSVSAYASADMVYMNDGDIPAGNGILGASPLGRLDPGESVSGSLVAEVWASPATHGYITLKIDDGGVVDESDEANNTFAARIDPTFEPRRVPVILAPGRRVFHARPTIRWTEIIGVQSYDLAVRDMATGRIVIRTNVTDNTFVPATDLNIGHHRAWVRTVGADGTKSAWSGHRTFRVLTRAIVHRIPRRIEQPSPTISWDAVPGAARYQVWLRDHTRRVSRIVSPGGLTGTSFTLSSADQLGLYDFWVRAVDASGLPAAWSGRGRFQITTAPVPRTPSGLTFDLTPTFDWDDVPGATHYDLWVRNLTTGQVQFIRQQNLADSEYTPGSNLPPGQYFWWVRAVNNRGPVTVFGQWSQRTRILVSGGLPASSQAPAIDAVMTGFGTLEL